MSCHSVSNNGYAHCHVRPCILTDIKNRPLSKSMYIVHKRDSLQASSPPTVFASPLACLLHVNFLRYPPSGELARSVRRRSSLADKTKTSCDLNVQKKNAKLQCASPVVVVR